ncbi:hypothetical protein V6N11_026676 [Hibiscus sabdariffa]|uniref:Uncharacterized protein n=1 Tax=Hibiscus sabdariffa TaxID=183260 RepID=A0ABR2SWG1_9ROSI
MESKQLTLNEAAQPLNDPVGLSKRSEISRIETLIQSVKKKVTIQSPKKPKAVMSGQNSGIMTSKHAMQNKQTAQPVDISAGLVNDGGTKKESDPFVLSKGSGSPAKKIETTSRSPTVKLFMKEEKIQPSKGSASVASKSGTRTLPSRLVTQRKDTTFDNQRQKHHIFKDHIVWEGFDDCIVSLEKSCLLCDGDLANEHAHSADRKCHNPAENVVLMWSCVS